MLTFIIGFAVARQVFGLFEERHKSFLASVWGLTVSELAFVAWHWTIAYQITAGLRIPAYAIIIMLLGIVAIATYESYQKHTHVRLKDIQLPLVFASLAVLIILLLFSGLWDAATL